MNDLNVLNVCKGEKWYRKVPCFFKAVKRGFQRATKGYCDSDTWDLDDYFLRLFHDSLKQFISEVNGWPDTSYPTFEDYIADLEEQLKKLDYLLSDDMEENEYWEDWSKVLEESMVYEPNSENDTVRVYYKLSPDDEELRKKCYARVDEIYNKRVNTRREVFDWLKTHYNELWW